MNTRVHVLLATLLLLAGTPAAVRAQIPNGDFETGPYTSISNWTVSGPAFIQGTPGQDGVFGNPQGARFATSYRTPGAPQEGSTGTLRSASFALTTNRLSFLATGWQGRSGQPPVLCYVALCLADSGQELGRDPAPDTGGTFVQRHIDVDPAYLGRQVYILVVDNNPDTARYQYIAVDDFKLAEGPVCSTQKEPHAFDPQQMHQFENDLYRVEIKKSNGAIARVVDKVGRLELCCEPDKAGNFTLNLAKGGMIDGIAQTLSSVAMTNGGMVLHWDGPLKTAAGPSYDLNVVMRIELAQQSVRFTLDVRNNTDQQVTEICYPLVGGDLFSRDAQPIGEWRLSVADITAAAMPVVQEYSYPGGMLMPWLDLASSQRGRGLFFASLDPRSRYKSARVQGSISVVPGVQALGRLSWIHTPYTKPGRQFDGPPVVLRFHDNDLQQACRFYREWFEAQFGKVSVDSCWLRRDPCYQDVMLLLPEGNVNMRFKDIPQYAADGLRCGMKTIMISGWNLGGHDAWYPYYEPDPRLGTWEDLKEALAKVHRMGGRAVFFVNFTQVYPGSKWYRDELCRYYAGHYGGWGMGTIGARLGWTQTMLWQACAASPEYRQIIVRQMRHLAEIGADGLHFDKVYDGQGVNCRTNVPDGVDADVAGSDELMKGFDEVAKACRAVQPNIAFSFEGCWDRQFPYSGGCRWWGPPPARIKMCFPECGGLVSLVQPYDYNTLNNCVLGAIHCMIGPKCYTASIGDKAYAPLGRYIREVMSIWEAEKETIFLGEPLTGADLKLADAAGIQWRTYRHRTTGRRAAVLANFEPTPKTVTVNDFVGAPARRIRLYQPYQQMRIVDLPTMITIPGEQIAVIGEEAKSPRERYR